MPEQVVYTSKCQSIQFAVWGREPDVTQWTSWLESTGECVHMRNRLCSQSQVLKVRQGARKRPCAGNLQQHGPESVSAVLRLAILPEDGQQCVGFNFVGRHSSEELHVMGNCTCSSHLPAYLCRPCSRECIQPWCSTWMCESAALMRCRTPYNKCCSNAYPSCPVRSVKTQ